MPLKPGMPGALLTLLVLVCGATVTWIGWRTTLHAERERARNELTLHAADVHSAVEDRLLAYEGLLRAGVGVINAFWPVSRERWQQFAAQLRLAAVYPGIQGVGFAVNISTPEQFAYWAGILRPLGATDLDAWPSEGGRFPQSAIVFLEPLEHRNRQALGYDMTSEPRRRRAMERARDTGAAALSSKVILVQDSRLGAHSAGFLLYVPVYATAATPSSLEERRSAVRGFVYSPFRAEDFFASALAAVSSAVTVEVFDGDEPRADALLYRSGTAEPLAAWADTRKMYLAGQHWTLRVWPAQRSFVAEARRPAILIAVGGAATTLLLAGIVMALALSRQRLHERVLSDQALAERELWAGQVLENALDAYIAIDASDTIMEWNRQAALLFGWPAHEVIGRKLAETIVPPDLRSRHLQAVVSFERRSQHTLLGRRLEMPALRRDGSEVLVELSIVQVSSATGPRFTASLRDISQQRQQAAEIQRLNETLEQRVAERTTQLEVANRELSSANHDLEAFTYSVSHDLRAPLRAVDGHVLQLLEKPATLSEQQQHHAAAVRRNIAHMDRLIEDLLNFAFVGRHPLEKRQLLLWDLIRPILQELPAAAQVVYEVSPDELGEVHADAALLRQALFNLLSNANKFSRNSQPPRIGIGSEMRAEGRVYFVRDNGVGFDMQYVDKLFRVFERLHDARQFEGTGVGLAIVKQIIERHGGKVWAESQPGHGATFYFTLGND